MSKSQSSKQIGELFDFRYNNKAWMHVIRWKTNRKKVSAGPLENSRRLKSLGMKAELKPIIADVYTELALRAYTKFELSIILACIFVAVISGIAAFNETAFLIVTLVSAWFATIGIRFYRHHIKCYWYIKMLNSQTCPHCGKSLGPTPNNIEFIRVPNH
jgi:hypothetical protein